MIDDVFVFDAVLHMGSFADLAGEGLASGPSEFKDGIKLMSRLSGGFDTLEGYVDAGAFPPELMGSTEAVFDTTFRHAPTDVAVAGNIAFMHDAGPFGGEIEFVKDFVRAHPERAILGGGAEPLGMGVMPPMGLNATIDFIDHQIRDLGARSIKFYPIAWKSDDEKIAYPMFEKARSLGVNVIQLHKNIPSLLEDIEMLSPADVQAASRDFPDMTFIIHHPMSLYFHETINIVARFPNVHLVCSPLLQYLTFRPRLAQEQLGALLQQVGSEKLLFGSEGPLLGDPTPCIEALMNLSIDDDLQEGYGYPEITRRDKENILGLNAARIFGMDVPAKIAELATLPDGR